jgi:hypothetical protein
MNKTILSLTFLLFLFICTAAMCQDSINPGKDIIRNPVMIDTVKNLQIDTQQVSGQILQDTALHLTADDKTLTNTKLFIYIVISAGGLLLFFYIFVLSLFRTFHKTRSSRQAIMLSWSSFFVVSVIWIFIVWGLVAGFWTSSSFVVVIIFLFVLSLITALISLKSK